MSEFSFYFWIGLRHILDLDGLDHILFIIALCAIYELADWKRVLILVTAFTIGHSVTLALATLEVIRVDVPLIEFLIPLTVLLTAATNIIRRNTNHRKVNTNYYFALFFGLIHGLGYSNLLRTLLGKDESIVTQLLAFNLGLEVGQIVIVAAFLCITFLVLFVSTFEKRDWRLIVSSAVAGAALLLIIESDYWKPKKDFDNETDLSIYDCPHAIGGSICTARVARQV